VVTVDASTARKFPPALPCHADQSRVAIIGEQIIGVRRPEPMAGWATIADSLTARLPKLSNLSQGHANAGFIMASSNKVSDG